MKCYDGIHWNIYEILPYQRLFNFINGIRKLGKTYTCQKYITDKCITTGCEGVYFVRTQDEKKNGILQDAFDKVLHKEFEGFEFKFKNDSIYIVEDGETLRRIWVCIAISEYMKIKKKSFPKVCYGIFDEYTLEDPSGYVDGWQEPDHFLSIYDTIDRDENRVVMFFLGNNTSFHNPYHMHPAFNIKNIGSGMIWKSKHVLFQRAEASKELISTCSGALTEITEGTDYGRMYRQGEYINDNTDFICKISGNSRYVFTLSLKEGYYGVYFDGSQDIVVISHKYDKTCRIVYSVNKEGIREGCIMCGRNGSSLVKWLGRKYRFGRVRYENMETKIKTEREVNYIG